MGTTMKHLPKCPHWNEKNQKCKLMDIVEELSKSNALLAKTVEAYAPQKTSLGPIPGSHGQVEGSSPTQMATVQTPPLPPFLSFLGGSPGDKQPKLPQIGEKEEQKEKQEYWEKELEKMDKKEKEK